METGILKTFRLQRVISEKPGVMVRIKWCGHSYFVIESGDLKIAIDPHDGGSLGLETCYVDSDLVLVTHNHYDHNAVEVAASRDSIVVRWREGRLELGNIRIEGFKFYHDKAQGKLRGETIAYKVTVEDLNILHLGDIGHMISDIDVRKLTPVDILLVPVGGVYTIDHQEAWIITQLLKPKLVIPMHYWIPGSLTPLNPVDRFLNIIKIPRVRVEVREVIVKKNELPEKTSVIVFP